jgi:hypothetical protein
MQRDEVIIRDMINTLQLVIEFGEGFNKESFIHDWKMENIHNGCARPAR